MSLIRTLLGTVVAATLLAALAPAPVVAGTGAGAAGATGAPPAVPVVRTTAWADNFKEGTLDPAAWRAITWSCKTPANIGFLHGNLRLTTTATTPAAGGTCPALGAAVDTYRSMAFGAGRGTMLVHGRFDLDPGSWDSFYLTGSKGAYPANGEIDFAEMLGKDPLVHHKAVHAAYLDGRRHPDGRLKRCTVGLDDALDTRVWHVYGVTWGPDRIVFTVDDVVQRTLTKAEFAARGCAWPFGDPANPQRLVLSGGVGVRYAFPGPLDPATLPATTWVNFAAFRP
jgi:beta-glucanase (GH16 family)